MAQGRRHRGRVSTLPTNIVSINHALPRRDDNEEHRNDGRSSGWGYRHYKGREYTVLGIARHSETEEEMVLYRQEYGDRGLWVRPKARFVEMVTANGQVVPRFQYLGSDGKG